MLSPERGFVHLDCQTSFSPGALGTAEGYYQAANVLGMEAFGLVDEDSFLAWVKADRLVREKRETLGIGKEIKIIYGQRFSFHPGPIEVRQLNAAFLAQDRQGLESLYRLAVYQQGDEGKKRELEVGDFQANREGLVVIASPEAYESLVQVFDPEQIFIEVFNFNTTESKRTLGVNLGKAQEFGAQVVAANRVWMVRQESFNQVLSLLIRAGALKQLLPKSLFKERSVKDLSSDRTAYGYFQKKGQEGRLPFSLYPYSPEGWFKPAKMMRSLFREVEDRFHPCQTTFEIARACQLDGLPPPSLPVYPVPEGMTPWVCLENLCQERARVRYKRLTPEIKKRLVDELEVIGKQKLANLFLIAYDLVKFCRDQKLRLVGIGSATGSLVCYLLGITQVDPLDNGLSYERFLSEAEMVDIDFRVPPQGQKEIFAHLDENYPNQGLFPYRIAVFPTFGQRGAIRLILDRLGLEREEITRIQELIFTQKKIPPRIESVLEVSTELAGRKVPTRVVSTHPSKVIFTGAPLEGSWPVRQDKSYPLVQIDKEIAKREINLDFVSDEALTLIEVILKKTGLSEEEIPPNDPQTLKMIYQGKTIGVPLLDTDWFQTILGEFRQVVPLEDFSQNDLVLMLAFSRPAARGSRHLYLRRRGGVETVEYHPPILREILGETLGTVVFQEQVTRLAIELAGFSPQKAQALRRAAGKGRIPEVLAISFLRDAIVHGATQREAVRVLNQIRSFTGYGFLKGHVLALVNEEVMKLAYFKNRFPQKYRQALREVGRGPYFGSYQFQGTLEETEENML